MPFAQCFENEHFVLVRFKNAAIFHVFVDVRFDGTVDRMSDAVTLHTFDLKVASKKKFV